MSAAQLRTPGQPAIHASDCPVIQDEPCNCEASGNLAAMSEVALSTTMRGRELNALELGAAARAAGIA